MLSLRDLRLTKDIAVRMIADALLLTTALSLGFILRFLWLVHIEGAAVDRAELADFEHSYLSSIGPLLAISLAVFSVSGFYTHGRAYRGRYKIVVIGQAASLSYILLGFLIFFVDGAISIPRGAILLAWLLTLVFLIGARLLPTFWGSLIRQESQHEPATLPAPKTVLVIGGAGYIGSALLPKLLDKGYNVRLLDLLLFGTEPIADLVQHPNLQIIQADFRQVDIVVAAMRGVDSVIHLGAIVGDPACALDEELTIEVNLMATRMIAEVAKGSGVTRFIFASTCSVYGASDELLDERSALNPVSLYARSKIASEKVLRELADDRFAPVILRFGTIYGLSGRTRFDLVVNLLTAKAVVERKITVSGGDQWRPFVHVDDAAQAVFQVLEAPDSLVHNQIFNVGSDGQNYTIHQIGDLIHCMVPNAALIDMGSDTDRRNYRVNFNKIRNVLNFSAQRTVEQGVQQVIDVITSGKVKNYQDAKYSNVKFLGDQGTSSLIRHQNSWAYALLNEMSFAEERTDEATNGLEPLREQAIGV